MFTTSIGSTSTDSMETLVRELSAKVDANNDGQVSTGEFGAFLRTLLSGVAGASDRGASLSAALTGVDANGDAIEAPASTWTDNNCQNGITFAGFSPQNHTDLVPADYLIPGKAEKYAVYSYLVANKIQPTGDWAPGVAAALNRKYNTTLYRAIDGETLGYFNEYVHSAPNGYGIPAGTYNPNATGEFFWGWL